MTKDSYFVEFPYYDLTLRQQERFKYLIKRFKENRSDLTEIKSAKMTEATNFLGILDQLIIEVNTFKKTVPKPGVEPDLPEPKRKKPTVKKKRTRKKKKAAGKPKKEGKESMKSLKLGLSQIRDELERM